MKTACVLSTLLGVVRALNSTIYNPILPGFYPDPSCVFVPELNNTIFCASSSFLSFPGIPITASKDLQHWNLVSHAFSRQDQLPVFAQPNTEVGGIWAPTLRYREGQFYLTTTHVLAALPDDDDSRWVNFIITTTDPYRSDSWSDPVYFDIDGYDPSLFWDDDGRAYLSWATLDSVNDKIIWHAPIDLHSGSLGARVNIWNGTGGIAPEGPHMYKKDGYYYLIIAEGGTGRGHMVTIARSRGIYGPYESNPLNPILTNANTTEYFQAVGHADLFRDASGHWWGVALSMRLGAEIVNGEQMFLSPMGRETVLYPVTWRENEWPILSPVRGEISAWPLPTQDAAGSCLGIWVTSSDAVDFALTSTLPANFVHYEFPETSYYDLSDNNSCGLRLVPSPGNLSFASNNSKDVGTTLLARRQSHTLFTFSVNLDFSPTKPDHEAGVTVFMSDQVHMELGIVSLAGKESTPHFRFHGRVRTGTVQTTEIEIPQQWRSQTLKLEIKAFNTTHYAFSAEPAAHASQLRTVAYAPARLITPIFTGALVGVYVTTNGQPGRSAPPLCVRSWAYDDDGQIRA